MFHRIELYSGNKRIGMVSGDLPDSMKEAEKKAVEVCRNALELPVTETIIAIDGGSIRDRRNFADGEVRFSPTGIGLGLMQKYMKSGKVPKASNSEGYVQGVW